MMRQILLAIVLVCGAACGGSNTPNPPDPPPTVTATVPAADAAYLYTSTTITATFSKTMDASTINSSTFTINNGVTGTVSYDPNNFTATFTAAAAFTKDTTYTATISASVKDATGQTMAADYVWSFTAREAPLPPSSLAATGILNKISLSWTAGSGGGLQGYKIYRSADNGTTFSRLNGTLVTGTTYDDTISSPGGDGIYYQYQVRSSGYLDSDPSNTAKQMHGTRLSSSYAAGLSLTSGGPYVAEGSVVVDGGDLTVASGIQLYLINSASLDLGVYAGPTNPTLNVQGLFQSVADSDHPATITAHKSGGLPDTQGWRLAVADTATAYNSTTGIGTGIQNTTLQNMQCHDDGISLGALKVLVYNNKISFNCSASPGTGYLYVLAGSSALLQHNSVSKGVLNVSGVLNAAFLAEYNIFSNSYYAISFAGHTGPAVASGQIVNNQFNGSQAAYMFDVVGNCLVALGGNYWPGGSPPSAPVPSTSYGGTTTCTFGFTTPLSAAPSGIGPSW